MQPIKDETAILEPDITFTSMTAADYYREALSLMQTGDEEDAMFALTEGIRLDPDVFKLYLTRAEALRRTGRLEEAKADIELYSLKTRRVHPPIYIEPDTKHDPIKIIAVLVFIVVMLFAAIAGGENWKPCSPIEPWC